MIGSLSPGDLAEGMIMAGIAAGGEIQRGPTTKNLGRHRAAGIYGAIVTAAILDTAGGHVSTTVLVISVVVALCWCTGSPRSTPTFWASKLKGVVCPAERPSGEH